MAMAIGEYKDARPDMQPGDVIAFGGKGHFMELNKFATRSDVSHVEVVLQAQAVDDTSGRFSTRSSSLHR